MTQAKGSHKVVQLDDTLRNVDWLKHINPSRQAEEEAIHADLAIRHRTARKLGKGRNSMAKRVYPDNTDFLKLALEHGIWIPWGGVKEGVHFETSRVVNPEEAGFGVYLRRVYEGIQIAWVEV